MKIKKPHEIEKIKQGGKLMGEVLQKVMDAVEVGVTTKSLDALAEKLVIDAGGRPAFKGYGSSKPFPGTICTSVNNEVVHGVPSDYTLKEGDILGIDIGMEWPYKEGGASGYYTDTAATVGVGEISQTNKDLLERTQQSLYKGLSAAVSGNSIADIGKAVEDHLAPFGYGIVTALVGHGVGHDVHEDPKIPNVYLKKNESVAIEPGMVLAIEPMVTLGVHEVDTAEDGWTVITRDGSIAAHFEHTIVVEKDGIAIVTQRPGEQINL